jgi:hypothetical protein
MVRRERLRCGFSGAHNHGPRPLIGLQWMEERMNTSAKSYRNAALRLAALPLAFAPLAGAVADDRDANAGSEANSASVATLKSSLPSTSGFEVDDVRMTDSGVACISYRVRNDLGGDTRAKAVVEGDKVLRSTTRTTRFAKAWNSKCVGAGRDEK